MKLFIWEGSGISDAYHDDGTLVVLAGSPDEARLIAEASAEIPRSFDEADNTRWTDGPNEAINRPPDRVVGIDEPCVVVFNGGGYD